MTKKLLTVLPLAAMLSASVATMAQYQLSNPGFESWEGTSATSRPSHWSSFPQADGSWAWAASTAQHYHRYGGRPGTAGSSYLTIYSRSVLGIVANGNMTTGQIHVGSTSATNASNYNYTHRGGSYCHTFSGTPDSMYVWVSYYAASASSQGSIRAYLHGNSDFRDPNDCTTPSLYRGRAVAEFGRTTSSTSVPTWVRQQVPFEYNGTSTVNYVLMSMTTNTTPGGGSANDSLSVDDIEFVYSAWLDNITLNGDAIDGFQRDVFDYVVSLDAPADLHSAVLAFTPQANDATVTVDTLTPNVTTLQYVLNVLAEDSLTSRTYTVTLTCPLPTCDTVENIAVNVQGTSALVTWTSGSNNQQWEVEYGSRGFVRGQGQTAVCDYANLLLDNLDYNSDYELCVRAYCGDSAYSDWSCAVAFTTGEEPDTVCRGVDSLVISEVGFTQCTLVIYSPYLDENGQNIDSVLFQVLLMLGDDIVADTIMSQTVIMVDHLQEGTNYVVYARTLCDSAHQSGWTLTTFATDADTVGIEAVGADKVPITIYPNPAQGEVTCTVQSSTASSGVIVFYDNMGRKMLERSIADSQRVDVSSLPMGLYTVVVQTDGGVALQRLSIVR
ncbi:MAG: T9SS type A sorting domain-containing protein [Bacteroidales bacterium]|nr:T9SS type A sorting domain-containing protein [Bacteroidales bacterium]